MPEAQTDTRIDWRNDNDGNSGIITVHGQHVVFIGRRINYVLDWKQNAMVFRFCVENDVAEWQQSVSKYPLCQVEHSSLWKLARCDTGITDLVRLGVKYASYQKPAYPDSYPKHLGSILSYHIINALICEKAKKSAPATMDAARMSRVLDYIEQNLHGKISMKALADAACLSLTHFKRLFKAGTGMSGRDYIFKERIHRAQALLQQGTMRIAEVADLCGFCDQSHLDRSFRRYCQCSPEELKHNGPNVTKNGPFVQFTPAKSGHNGGTVSPDSTAISGGQGQSKKTLP